MRAFPQRKRAASRRYCDRSLTMGGSTRALLSGQSGAVTSVWRARSARSSRPSHRTRRSVRGRARLDALQASLPRIDPAGYELLCGFRATTKTRPVHLARWTITKMHQLRDLVPGLFRIGLLVGRFAQRLGPPCSPSPPQSNPIPIKLVHLSKRTQSLHPGNALGHGPLHVRALKDPYGTRGPGAPWLVPYAT